MNVATPVIAVLAGGLATRLGALAKDTPKALQDVAGRPFLAWQLEMFAARGLRDVVLCIGHHGQQIESWVVEHAPAELRVRFSHDGHRPIGTGGALRRALPLLGESFLVAYGDSYLRCDYLGVHRAFERFRSTESAGAPLGLMTVYQNDNQFDVSNVVFRDGHVVRYDKGERSSDMRHIDWGLGVLTPAAFAKFPPDQQLDLATVYQELISEGRLAALEVSERFYEIGSAVGLDEFRRYIGSAMRARG